jgi:deoxyribose-phosphate aldolase
MDYTYNDIAKMIDHSLLNPTLTDRDLEQGCQLALRYDVGSVCIMPYRLQRCARSPGAARSGERRSVSPRRAHDRDQGCRGQAGPADGGQELDMVVNISKVLSGDWTYVCADIAAVIDVTHKQGQKVKVIFENCYLNNDQKIKLCEICGGLGADWVKTSTGYGTGGATIEDLKLMRHHTPKHVQVKAAGGIRDLDKLLEVRAIGVTRVGATHRRDA